MKIIFIIDSLQRHGAQRFLVHLVHGLRSLGYDQSVIVLNNVCDPGIAKQLTASGCDIIGIGKAALLLGGFGWWRLVAILKRRQPDAVMTMLDFADTLGRPAARLAGCRVLLSSIRVRNLSKPAWRRRIDRQTIGWADKIIFNTSEVVRYAQEIEGVRPNQVVVIPNGVEDLRERIAPARAEYRRQLGVSSDTVVIGSIGRLHAQKNVALFVRALAKLPAKLKWKATVLGDGPQLGDLRRLAQELEINREITWLGERYDVEGWLSTMDLLVHTADFEGMPNAVMEAMASGLPVVASAVDGARDLIVDEQSGYLVPAGAVEGFVQRITQLAQDPALRKRMGENAHRRILGNFGMEQMIREYDALFNSLGQK